MDPCPVLSAFACLFACWSRRLGIWFCRDAVNSGFRDGKGNFLGGYVFSWRKWRGEELGVDGKSVSKEVIV